MISRIPWWDHEALDKLTLPELRVEGYANAVDGAELWERLGNPVRAQVMRDAALRWWEQMDDTERAGFTTPADGRRVRGVKVTRRVV